MVARAGIEGIVHEVRFEVVKPRSHMGLVSVFVADTSIMGVLAPGS
jgi:hypothetical protein